MPLSNFVPAYPSPSPCPQVHSLHLRHYSCPAPRFFITFFFLIRNYLSVNKILLNFTFLPTLGLKNNCWKLLTQRTTSQHGTLLKLFPFWLYINGTTILLACPLHGNVFLFLTSLKTKQVSGWVGNNFFFYFGAACQETEMFTSGDTGDSRAEEGLVWGWIATDPPFCKTYKDWRWQNCRLQGNVICFAFNWSVTMSKTFFFFNLFFYTAGSY